MLWNLFKLNCIFISMLPVSIRMPIQFYHLSMEKHVHSVQIEICNYYYTEGINVILFYYTCRLRAIMTM